MSILLCKCKKWMGKTASIPYGNRTVSKAGNSMRIERVCRYAMDFTGNIGRGRDVASEIEETEPPV
jgi:hypothetical protein